MALPEKPKKVLTILYQNYLQHGYTQLLISYDSFDCPKSELSGPLDTLKEYGYISSYTRRKDGILYSITAEGIDFCSEPVVPKASISINDTILSDLQNDLLNDLLSDIDNPELSGKGRKAKIKGHLSTLMSSLSAETFTDILSDILCR